MLAKGNGSGRALRAFVVGSTMVAGGCLGFALGIQSALEVIGRQPGALAAELHTYQYSGACRAGGLSLARDLMERSRRAGTRIAVGGEEDAEFEAHFIKRTRHVRDGVISARHPAAEHTGQPFIKVHGVVFVVTRS